MIRDLDYIRESVERHLIADDPGALVPCSRYGHNTETVAPAAAAAAIILNGETDGDLTETAEYVMGLCVNDRPDPARLLIEYGAEYGIRAADYIDPADFPEGEQ